MSFIRCAGLVLWRSPGTHCETLPVQFHLWRMSTPVPRMMCAAATAFIPIRSVLTAFAIQCFGHQHVVHEVTTVTLRSSFRMLAVMDQEVPLRSLSASHVEIWRSSSRNSLHSLRSTCLLPHPTLEEIGFAVTPPASAVLCRSCRGRTSNFSMSRPTPPVYRTRPYVFRPRLLQRSSLAVPQVHPSGGLR